MIVVSILFLICTLGCVLITIKNVRKRKEYALSLLLAVSCLFLCVICFLNYKGVIGDSSIMNLGEAFEFTNW